VSFGLGGGASFGSARGFLYVDASGVTKGITTAQLSLQKFETQSQRVGRVAGAVGKQAGGFAAIGALGIGTAVKQFVDFEEQLRAVASITGDTDRVMGEFRQTIEGMSVDLGVAPAELAQGLYEIAQAGVPAGEAMEILGIAAKAAVAGMTTVEVAARPLVAVINAYGKEAYTAAQASDILFQATTDGVFSFEELSTQLGDNLSLASNLNISLEELSSAYVVLTRRGNSLAESTTQINGIMNGLLKPSEAMKDALKQLGFESGEALIEQEGLVGALQMLLSVAGDSSAVWSQMFQNSRGLRGEMGLLADEGALWATELQRMNKAGKEGTATQKVFAEQAKSTAFQLKQTREMVRNAAISIGEDMAPAVLKVAQVAADAAQGLSQLNDATGGAFASGLVYTTAILALVSALGKLIDVGVAAVGTLETIATVGGLISLSIGAPILAAVGILAFFTARAFINHKKHEEAVKELEESYESLTATIRELGALEIATAAQQNALNLFQNGLKEISLGYDAWIEKLKKLNEAQGSQGLFAPPDLQTLPGDNFADAQTSLIDYVNAIKEATLDTGELADVNADLDTILNTQGISIERITQLLTFLLKQHQLWISTNGQLGMSGDFIASVIDDVAHNTGLWTVEALANSEAVDEEAKAAEKAAAEQLALNDALAETGLLVGPFADTADELIDFAKSLNDVTNEALAALGALADLSDPLQFLRVYFGKASTSVEDFLLKLQSIGAGGIHMTPAIKAAVKMAEHFRQVEAALVAIDASIAENTEDTSMWQGRIDLIDNTIGTVEDGYKALNDMVASGAITEQEAADIYEDAMWLRERSLGGIEDERVQLAKNIQTLRDYVEAHDQADQAIKDATPQQQQFIAAMQSQEGQIFLTQLELLSYLASVGQIPDEKVTEFIITSAAENEIVAGLVEDLNLLAENDVEVDVIWHAEDAIKDLTEVEGAVATLSETGLSIVVRADSRDALRDFMELNDVLPTTEGFRLLLDNRLLNDSQTMLDAWIETADTAFGTDYHATLDFNDDGAISEVELLKSELRDVARQWTA
jgi:TP901 family phage tail tape measure protein